MNPGFWSGKRVFLTGHTGFKGAWLCLLLKKCGAHVAGFSVDVPTKPSLFDLAKIESEVQTVFGDIRNLEALSSALNGARPDVVIHMAAQSLVRASYEDPLGTFSVNALGTANLLEAARRSAGIRAIVVVTSDKCYLNREWEWGYREDEPLGGRDPYSASKACAEIVTAAMRDSFFRKSAAEPSPAFVASVRAGNVIGGGDWARDRLVPDVMAGLLEGRDVLLRNPRSCRPWQHVLDPLDGYLTLAERMWESGAPWAEAWNFGPSDEGLRSVSEVVEGLIREWGKGRWRQDEGAHPHEANLLKLDCAKSRTRLGWKPRWDFEETLRSIAAWYKVYGSQGDLRRVSLDQVEEHLSRTGSVRDSV